MSYTVSEINIYPIKSCAGTSLTEAHIGATGFENDRRWMICDADGNFFTQREFFHMALIKPELFQDNGRTALRLSAPNMEPFQFEPGETGRKMGVEIWGDRCRAIDQGEAVARWLSQYLEVPSRLVSMDPQFARGVDERYRVENSDQVGFADGYPVLLISQASLDELNGRLSEPILMNRFRPNLVVEGCTAFEEDTWKTVKIGAVKFSVVKPCDRCVITTIEQSTARGGLEPLKTLATYRRVEKKILFGENLIHRNTGRIKLADTLEVLASVEPAASA